MPEALGTHLLVELHGCDPNILNDVPYLERCLVEAAREAGATVINTAFHHFAPYGVSGVVVIQESHLAIHTWPEYGFAAVDLFTCGQTLDPWMAYQNLKSKLNARHGTAQEMPRGSLDQVKKIASLPAQPRTSSPPSRNIWFTEKSDQIAHSIRHAGLLFEAQSPYQKIQILDTYGYGKMLVADGRVLCTEKDEFVYHEMIVHIPVFAHPDPHTVLVIGGGDGGAVRELTRHTAIQSITQIEIDETLIQACEQHLPTLSQASNDPRLDLKITDGVRYLQTCPPESFDLILVDAAAPTGPAEGLFTPAFYQSIHRCLTPSGIMVAQSPPPTLQESLFSKTLSHITQAFQANHTHCYLAFLPTYPTGLVSFTFAAKDGIHPFQNLDADRIDPFVQTHALKYYTRTIHQAAFALPGYIQSLLPKQE
ncbi:MAG: polyamine aminopropyltransferase [bacterium]|nr:polyamine aminopropyltransferase [bacterium]